MLDSCFDMHCCQDAIQHRYFDGVSRMWQREGLLIVVGNDDDLRNFKVRRKRRNLDYECPGFMLLPIIYVKDHADMDDPERDHPHI